MKKKCTKKKLTAEQKAAQLKKRKVLAFRKKIRSSFTDAGFTYFSTLDKHFPIGTRTVELDYLFLYENIIVICEDNTKQKKDIDHIRNKNESFAEIRNNKTAFLNWLSNTFPEKETMVKQYRPERYFLYYIYISQTELEITDLKQNLKLQKTRKTDIAICFSGILRRFPILIGWPNASSIPLDMRYSVI